jgi:hypothetical protein
MATSTATTRSPRHLSAVTPINPGYVPAQGRVRSVLEAALTDLRRDLRQICAEAKASPDAMHPARAAKILDLQRRIRGLDLALADSAIPCDDVMAVAQTAGVAR